MTPEIARIIRSFSPQERAMWARMGGRIPPGTPKPVIVWRARDVFPVWTKTVKKGRAA